MNNQTQGVITPKKPIISHQDLISLLHYNEETGVFAWLKNRGKYQAGTTAGTVDRDGYVKIGILKRNYFAHRLAWFYITGEFPKLDIDHIDGDRKNNKFSNLRVVSKAINRQNRRTAQSCNKTGLLGVSVNRNKYRAKIYLNKKAICIGVYDTPEEAHEAYLAKKREIHIGCTI